MTFIIVEQDPFVRADLKELLCDCFPHEPVCSMETPAEFLTWATKNPLSDLIVTLISAPISDVIALHHGLGALADRVRFVLMDDAPQGAQDSPEPWPFVSRPFSGDMVINAIKTVILPRPASR